jgi:hypothetical protein
MVGVPVASAEAVARDRRWLRSTAVYEALAKVIAGGRSYYRSPSSVMFMLTGPVSWNWTAAAASRIARRQIVDSGPPG